MLSVKFSLFSISILRLYHFSTIYSQPSKMIPVTVRNNFQNNSTLIVIRKCSLPLKTCFLFSWKILYRFKCFVIQPEEILKNNHMSIFFVIIHTKLLQVFCDISINAVTVIGIYFEKICVRYKIAIQLIFYQNSRWSHIILDDYPVLVFLQKPHNSCW